MQVSTAVAGKKFYVKVYDLMNPVKEGQYPRGVARIVNFSKEGLYFWPTKVTIMPQKYIDFLRAQVERRDILLPQATSVEKARELNPGSRIEQKGGRIYIEEARPRYAVEVGMAAPDDAECGEMMGENLPTHTTAPAPVAAPQVAAAAKGTRKSADIKPTTAPAKGAAAAVADEDEF